MTLNHACLPISAPGQHFNNTKNPALAGSYN